MAKKRRVIRQVRPPAESFFDERLWPILLTLVMLGAFIAGATVAYLRFDDPRWYANAWTSLFIVGVLVFGGAFVLARIDGRRLRRAMQLSLLLCTILHLALLLLLHEMEIFGRNSSQTNRNIAERRPPVTMPDYAAHHFLDPDERPQQDFEKPVETQIPETQPQEVARPPTNQPESPAERPTPSTPVEQPTAVPNLARRAEPDQTIPRQSEQTSKLSRQTQSTQLYSPAQLPVPQAAAATNQTPLEAATAAAARRNPAQPTQRRPTSPESEASIVNPTAQATRRNQDASPESPAASTPTLPRAVARPERLPRTEVASQDAPSTARQTATDALAPASTPVRRQATSSPRQLAQANTPAPVTSTETSPTKQERQSPAESRPDVAQTPQPLPAPRTRVTARPEPLTGAADVASIQRARADQSLPQPQVSQLTRAARESPPVARTSLEPAIETAGVSATAPNAVRQNTAPAQPAAPSTNVAMASPRRPSTSTANPATAAAAVPQLPQAAADSTASSREPSANAATVARQPNASSPTLVQGNGTARPAPDSPSPTPANAARRAPGDAVASMLPDNPASRSPARSSRAAATTASPTAAERPALAAENQGDANPTTEPARLALTKSLSGTAGVGQSLNLDRALAAANSPAATASVAAQRSQAVQDSPTGPALAPSSQTQVARSRANAQAPSSSFAAELTDHGTVAGSRQTSELSASASASLTRDDANAQRGETSAAKGAADVDVGATRVVDEGGTGRASGGGQPEINLESQARQLARRDSGGSAQAALNTSNQADATAAPTADGGGKPGETLDAVATVVNRGRGDQDATSTATKSSAARADGTGEPEASAAAQNDTGVVGVARRADASATTATGDTATGDDESEDEKRRRLARSQSGAPSAAAPATATSAEVASAASNGTSGGAASDSMLAADRTELSKSAIGGVGNLSGANVAATAEPERSVGGELTAGAPISRAEAVDAPAGPPATGGGTNSPMRSSTGPTLAAVTEAATPDLAGMASSSGQRQGLELQVEGLTAERTAGGAPGSPARASLGAAAGPTSDAPVGAEPIVGTGRGRRATGSADGPVTDKDSVATAPVRRAEGSSLSVDTLASIDFSKVESPSEGPGDAMGPAAPSLSAAAVSLRAPGGAITVEIEAAPGPGGLGDELALNVGLNQRRATAESPNIDLNSGRFVRQNSGGLPRLTTAAVMPAEAFRQRASRKPGDQMGKGGGQLGPQTEEAIELGLAYLARQQLSDGSWRLQGPGEEVMFLSDTAATGLALLSFQGAGYNHREHKYADTVFAGLNFLVKNQKENGDLYLALDAETSKSAWLYSHSIAAIALCESYGMTQDPGLRAPAQKALDFIVNSQNKQVGGWRYAPNYSADTSVSGWMMMALKSGELAGLEVPREVFANIEKWLDAAQVSPAERHLYVYNPYAPDTDRQRHGRKPTKTMTAVGLLMRLYTGWKRDNPHMQRGGEYLLEAAPAMNERDTYYWYYATQVMFHLGGDAWEQWNAKLHPLLVNTQEKRGNLAGSWDPRQPAPDQWGPRVGRLYVTTMNLLSLEVYYRHLPLYLDVAK